MNPRFPKLYYVSWSDHEDYRYCIFFHPDHPTSEQFQTDCKSLVKKYRDEYLKARRDDYSGELVQFLADKLPELGYIEAELGSAFTYFGDDFNVDGL